MFNTVFSIQFSLHHYIMTSWTLLIAVICILSSCNGADILVVFPTPSRSHFQSFLPLFIELAKRGHNMTVMSAFPLHEQISNYNQFDLKDIDNDLGITFSKIRTQTRLQNMCHLHEKLSIYSGKFLSQKPIQQFLQNPNNRFDLVFIELYYLDSFVGFGYHFGASVIGLSTQNLIPVYSWIMRNPAPSCCSPNLYLPFTDEMNLAQRLINTGVEIYSLVLYKFLYASRFQYQFEKYFNHSGKPDVPRVEDLIRKISAVFVNSHFSAGYAKPNNPNVIDLAGIHMSHQQNSVSKDLEMFMNESVGGFIYISMGSMLQPEHLISYEQTLLSVLSNLTYNVVWKWKLNSTKKLPENMLVREWLPQNEILGHPNCKLFITHGGYHSLLEAINAAVPIVGIPFHADQQFNLALVEKLGIGVKAEDLDKEILEKRIETVLKDTRYQTNVKLQSELFNDRVINPLDNAVYWSEYIIRHKGASHLQVASRNLYWFQYLLLDIILIVSFMVFILILVIKTFVNIIYRLKETLPTSSCVIIQPLKRKLQ